MDIDEIPALIPARMVNEYAYCPRLFHLEWVQGLFENNTDTAQGTWEHRSVDKVSGRLPEPEKVTDLRRATSVSLSSERLGLVATIDLLEMHNGRVVPVDTKKGNPPKDGSPAWESDMVQLCVQGVLLREHGYECDHGELYFSEARQRRVIEFTDELIARTWQLIDSLKKAAKSEEPPPPLIDSPKCPRCSLVGICLPDETNELSERSTSKPRMLIPRLNSARPLYVTKQGAHVGLSGGRVVITYKEEKLGETRVIDISQINLYGNAQVSSQLIRKCFSSEIPVLWFSYGGWFSGLAEGLPAKNVELRRRQAGISQQAGLPVAQQMINGKIRNSRTLLMRNARSRNETAIASLKTLADEALTAPSVESLLGFEGAAARIYFGEMNSMLRPDIEFDFTTRNRRPPKDPVNCLLSFLYSLLIKDLTSTVFGVGFDPYIGVLHRPRFGRPALALDLAEEFRPLIADSVALSLINNGEIKLSDFTVRSTGVALTDDGRRSVIAAYERRLDSSVTHPRFGYTVSYRRILEVQTRVLAAYVMREVPMYQPFVTR